MKLSLISTVYKLLFHTEQYSQSFTISSSHFLVRALNNGYFSASGLKPSLNGSSLPTELSRKFVSLITLRHGPRRKHTFYIVVEVYLPRRCVATVVARNTENTASNSSSVVTCWFLAVGTCLFAMITQ
jgi:hypothetical protein